MEPADGRCNDILTHGFENIRHELQRELLQQQNTFAQERQTLLNKIAELGQYTARNQELGEENERLRLLLKSDASSVNEQRPLSSSADNHPTSKDTNGNATENQSAQCSLQTLQVSYKDYKRLAERYEKLTKVYDNAKRQGGHYEKSYYQLREKFALSKAAVKEWQNYAESLKARSRSSSSNKPSAPMAEPLGNALFAVSAEEPSRRVAARRSFPDHERFHSSAFPSDSSHGLTAAGSRRSMGVDAGNANDNVRALPDVVTWNQAPDMTRPVFEEVRTATFAADSSSHAQTQNAFEQISARLGQVAKDPRDANFSNDASSHKGPELPRFGESANVENNAEEDLDHRSSQTTDIEAPVADDDANRRRRENQNSDPVVVCERPVKRRRRNGTTTEHSTVACTSALVRAGSNCEPIFVKDEPCGSSPIGLAGIQHLMPNESLDLDEVPGHVDTPKKRSRISRHLLRSAPASQDLGTDVNVGRSQSAPVEREKLVETTTSAQHRHNDADSEKLADDVSRSTFEIRDSQDYDDDMLTQLDGADLCKLDGPAGASLPNPRALKPLSVNRTTLPRSSKRVLRFEQTEALPSQSLQDYAAEKRAFLSRISDAPAIADNPPHDPPSPTPAASASEQSSQDLTSAFPNKPPAQKPLPTPRSLSNPRSSSKEPRTDQQRKPHTPSAFSSRTTTPRSIAGPSASKPPLRHTPLAELTPDDFKINPRANGGHAHAFNEVVRGKHRRRCLPGCTRAECCGARFRAMVRVGGALPSTSARRRLWDAERDTSSTSTSTSTSTSAAAAAVAAAGYAAGAAANAGDNDNDGEDEEEARLLDAYLGTDRAQQQRLTPSERAEALLAARAERLAAAHGRHRHAYARSGTPPGFWRTGMPSTQELEGDRRAAREMERGLVGERYREAVKGGRWLFRDE